MPLFGHVVAVPVVEPDLCSARVLTMSFLDGPKLEAEARRQLLAVGVDVEAGVRGQCVCRETYQQRWPRDSLLGGQETRCLAAIQTPLRRHVAAHERSGPRSRHLRFTEGGAS